MFLGERQGTCHANEQYTRHRRLARGMSSRHLQRQKTIPKSHERGPSPQPVNYLNVQIKLSTHLHRHLRVLAMHGHTDTFVIHDTHTESVLLVMHGIPSDGASTHAYFYFSCCTCFPDTTTYTSSAAKPQSLQRAPSTRPRPGSTAPPSYRSHTRKGCTTFTLPHTCPDRTSRRRE
eukprot:365794-Chlamydomonas_euryale.AAC.2